MRHWHLPMFALALTASIASVSHAQTPESEPAATFADLALRLPPQSFLVVTDQQGRRTGGRLIGIERSTLSIKTDRPVTFSQPDVQIVQRKLPDSVLDGGVIGFAIGMALPLIVCTSISDSSETVGCAIGAAGFGGLSGFAIGALIDRVRGRMVTIFRSPQGSVGATNP
jgi:hypothetical protein